MRLNVQHGNDRLQPCSQRRTGLWFWLVAGSAVTLVLHMTSPAAAEEKRWASATTFAPLLAYASTSADLTRTAHLYTAPTQPSTQAAEQPANFFVPLTLQLADSDSAEKYFNELGRELRGDGLFAEGSMILFRTRIPTRYSYRSWAGFHGGYGQIFETPDLIGRSRTNGAGIDDPACVYVKMSYRF